jgi:membrane-bound ClpP family serine protease
MNKDCASCMMSASVGILSFRSNGCFGRSFCSIKSIGVVLYQVGTLMIYMSAKMGLGFIGFLDLRVSICNLFLLVQSHGYAYILDWKGISTGTFMVQKSNNARRSLVAKNTNPVVTSNSITAICLCENL